MMRKGILALICLGVCATGFAQRDPTAPMSSSGNSGSPYKIEGIFITNSKRMVLMGGKYLIVGDKVNGGKIIAILKDRIVIETGRGKKVYPFTRNIRKTK